MYIAVTRGALTTFKALIANSYKVDCFIPYEVSETCIDNVMSYLKCTDTSSPAIIVCVHKECIIISNNYNSNILFGL